MYIKFANLNGDITFLILIILKINPAATAECDDCEKRDDPSYT